MLDLRTEIIVSSDLDGFSFKTAANTSADGLNLRTCLKDALIV